MKAEHIERKSFLLESDGLHLRVFTAFPTGGATPYPSVQIHHAGGGYEIIYRYMIEDLAKYGFAGIALIHRGYPGSDGRQEYGQGEISDIGNLVDQLKTDPRLDIHRMGIMGYSRGAHNALLAVERYDCFQAAALWSPPVDMIDHVQVNPWVAEIIGGSSEELPELYHQLSAIHFVHHIRCPLLLIHGAKDDIIPVRHTLRLTEVLKQQGKPYEVIYHPQEGHTWSIDALFKNWQLTLDFFERFLR